MLHFDFLRGQPELTSKVGCELHCNLKIMTCSKVQHEILLLPVLVSAEGLKLANLVIFSIA